MSNKLPSVTSDIPRDLRTFIDRLREIISGTGTNRLVSVQDLITGGIAGPGSNGTITPPTTANIGTPPAPQNVTATGAIYNVLIEWDSPTYFGHDYSEIYGGSTNVIGDAVQLAFVPGVNYADPIGPSQSRYYWVRFVNTLGVKGPFNSVSGTLGTTGPEVQHLLDTLTGAITETELFSELGSRIDLVDTTNGGLINKYTVKIDNNGYVSGFGLASTSNTATPYSDFIIRADRFSIASPSGPGITPVIPFIVTTTTTVINGVTVTPGVYINGAFIQGGSIQGANIAGGTIENSKLINVSANKITGAALEATSYIESAAYIAGSQGWKIHANGTAEFAAASIRGQLTAGQIDTRNLTIKDSSGNVLFGAGTNLNYANITASSGWLNSNITLNSNGTLSGAGGGTVSLSGLGAGAFATLSQITDVNISTYIAGAAIDTAYIKNLAVKTALIDNLAVTNAKIDNLAVTSAKIDNLAVTSAKIGDAEVGTLKIAGNAVTVPVTATGAVGTTFSTGVSVSIKTSATTYPSGTTISTFFTALKTAFGAGDIDVILNCLTSSNTLVATFAGSSTGALVQTMGPSGDKVTAIFTGTYTIPYDGSFKIEAIVSNPYGGSWTADYCTVIVLGSKR